MTTVSISNAAPTASADRFVVWPRRRSTSIALGGLLLVQTAAFLVVTQPSFFFLDDYLYFKLAEERPFIIGLLTPVLGVYPAPGDRLLSYVLQQLTPLNFTVARLILLTFLAGTTVILWQLVRMFARSDRWWTVALLIPFALSLTLVVPVAWWSAGLPIIPALFFTVVAMLAWLRSYTDARVWPWVAVAVIAVAAAGAFYVKFLLIPVYLLFFRLVILPPLLGLGGGVRDLWRERGRWIALAIPPAAFLAVWILSGIAGRSAAGGSRPYLAFFATAWFRVFAPAAFLNGRLNGPVSSFASWAVVVGAQLLFLAVVVATWIRSRLAIRAWSLFLFVFFLNAGVVGTDRLPAFGVQIAYALRYYPEIALFLPLTLALCLREGEERRPDLAWERTRLGQAAIGLIAATYLVSLGVWAPGVVSDYQGVAAKAWYQNLRHDLEAVTADGTVPHILDSKTPDFVMEAWMAPVDHVSTVLSLAGIPAVYNRLSPRTYLVRGDGHLALADFQPTSSLVSGMTLAPGVRIFGEAPPESGATCVDGGGSLQYRPDRILADRHLAIGLHYARPSRRPILLHVRTSDANEVSRVLELKPFQNLAELVDLEPSSIRGFQLRVSSGDRVCIQRLDIGSLEPRGD